MMSMSTFVQEKIARFWANRNRKKLRVSYLAVCTNLTYVEEEYVSIHYVVYIHGGDDNPSMNSFETL